MAGELGPRRGTPASHDRSSSSRQSSTPSSWSVPTPPNVRSQPSPNRPLYPNYGAAPFGRPPADVYYAYGSPYGMSSHQGEFVYPQTTPSSQSSADFVYPTGDNVSPEAYVRPNQGMPPYPSEASMYQPEGYWQPAPPAPAWSQGQRGAQYMSSGILFGQHEPVPYGENSHSSQVYDEDGNPLYSPMSQLSPHPGQYAPYLPPPITYPPYNNSGAPSSAVYQQPRPAADYQGRPYSPAAPPAPSQAPVYTAQPLPELTRGYLAQANLHNAAYGRPQPLAHQYPEQQHRRRQPRGIHNQLPKPPPHSEWAMWVGNIPSDATHAELWRFFTSRPTPAAAGLEHNDDDVSDPDALPDLNTVGVQSIHLIARSNCCFVNYASAAHLQQAMNASTGVSLRYNDARSKPLVCRVRRKSDDTKTGVGAQRAQHIHQQWAAAHPGEPNGDVKEGDGVESAISPAQHQMAYRSSGSTASTSSSFLSKHFLRRYFVLKSHTEDDLELSVKSGVWATQSHNEPVLDQAFRTSRDAVFLFFSANKTGEFFGVAKMAGPVFRAHSHSLSSRGTDLATTSSGSLLSQKMTIEEGKTFQSPSALQRSSAAADGHILSTTDGLFSSPLPATPRAQSEEPADPQAAKYIAEARRRLRERMAASDPTPATTTTALLEKDGEEETIASRRGANLDIDLLADAEGGIKDLSIEASNGPSLVHDASPDEDGVVRRDTLLSPSAQNAHIEQIEVEQEKKAPAARNSASSVDKGWGRPFKLQWLSTKRVLFPQTRHIKNRFNQDRAVQISRDGTELDPSSGEALLALFIDLEKAPEAASSSTPAP